MHGEYTWVRMGDYPAAYNRLMAALIGLEPYFAAYNLLDITSYMKNICPIKQCASPLLVYCVILPYCPLSEHLSIVTQLYSRVN